MRASVCAHGITYADVALATSIDAIASAKAAAFSPRRNAGAYDHRARWSRGGEVIVLLPVVNEWSRCEFARQMVHLIIHEGGAITAWVAKWPVSPDRDEYWPLERYYLSCKWIDKCIMIGRHE